MPISKTKLLSLILSKFEAQIYERSALLPQSLKGRDLEEQIKLMTEEIHELIDLVKYNKADPRVIDYLKDAQRAINSFVSGTISQEELTNILHEVKEYLKEFI